MLTTNRMWRNKKYLCLLHGHEWAYPSVTEKRYQDYKKCARCGKVKLLRNMGKSVEAFESVSALRK